VAAARALVTLPACTGEGDAKRNVNTCVKAVAGVLGNTPAVCRSAYVHPAVLERYLAGETIEPVMRKTPRAVEAEAPPDFYPEEAALMRALEAWEE
jgi:DNA topoisomerase-1